MPQLILHWSTTRYFALTMRPVFAIAKCEPVYGTETAEDNETILGEDGSAEDLMLRIQELTREIQGDPKKAQQLRDIMKAR